MYVHNAAEPKRKIIPGSRELEAVYDAQPKPTENDLRFFSEVEHPAPVWSISAETFDAMLAQNRKPSLFVEIGTFIGNGVIEIDRNMKRRGVSCPIIAVDNFAGT